MYARSTTIRARPESLDAGIELVRDEVMPAILRMEGCVGLSMIADRESGLCITTSAWRSAEVRKASEAEVRLLRQRMSEILGGPPEVEKWEISLMHRDHRSQQGSRVRATWLKAEPAGIDRVVDFHKNVTLPTLEGVTGFCSSSQMIDRTSGRAVVSVTYDSVAAAENSRETARGLRERFVRETRAQILDVQEFDLVLAHLHAPELV